MVLFKLKQVCVPSSSALLYIPLWYYSNPDNLLCRSHFLSFTFHYGPIQINSADSRFHFFAIYIPLWSYSNQESAPAWFDLIDLHSTMVLFKWKNKLSNAKFTHIYIPLWSYSNNIRDIISISNKGFTFHYGPIQMW